MVRLTGYRCRCWISSSALLFGIWQGGDLEGRRILIHQRRRQVLRTMAESSASKVAKLCAGEPSLSVCTAAFWPWRRRSGWRVPPDRGSAWPLDLHRQAAAPARFRADATRRNRRACTGRYGRARDRPDDDGWGPLSDRWFSSCERRARHSPGTCSDAHNRRCRSPSSARACERCRCRPAPLRWRCCRKQQASSPMSSVKCLATLYWLTTLPTRTPILSSPTSRPASTIAWTFARFFSVACSSASRLCARILASCELRQAIRRSPG